MTSVFLDSDVETLGLKDLDMMIRSATSLLSLINPQLNPEFRGKIKRLKYGKLKEERKLHRFDRLANLLLSKHSGEVSCIMINQTTELTQILMSTHVSSGLNANSSDSEQISEKATTSLAGTAESATYRRDTWLLDYARSACLTLPIYTQVLEELIQLYCRLQRSWSFERNRLRQETSHLVFIFCLPKILRHFRAPLCQDIETTYFGFFSDTIAWRVALLDGYIEDPPEAKLTPQMQSERKFEWVLQQYVGDTFDFEYDDNNLIIFSRTALVSMHRMFCKLLEHINLKLDVLEMFTHRPSNMSTSALEARRDALLATLQDTERLFGILSDLTHRSITFRKYLYQPSVRRLFITQFRLSWNATCPNILRANQEKKALQLLEDELVVPDVEYFHTNPIDCCFHWLERSLQHWEAVRDLLGEVKVPVKFIVLPSFPRHDVGSQLSLRELIGETVEEDSVDSVLSNLAKWAVRKMSNCIADGDSFVETVLDTETELHVLDTLIYQNLWPNEFKSTHHCQAVMTSLKHFQSTKHCEFLSSLSVEDARQIQQVSEALKKTSPQMGTSELCCYMCYLYCRALVPSTSRRVRVNSGKIFPWAMPPWETNIQLMETVWQEVRQRLIEALKSIELELLDPDAAMSDI
ncbi:hypothetical protein BJ508DRAFT_350949 [Ascobolus immersus RN42]|uniref:Uncharacterized protein n=1 Tax=Ascobolus immersus RN42 TaxID=1160509 RepID=A0A3N4IH09_ASCIM|nr:hypothetical protein BJ508DRAFT_350949 [Ascobolus immersus RN42]